MAKKLCFALLIFCLIFSLSACETGQLVLAGEDGVGRGGVGDLVRTESLDVKVLSAKTEKDYAGLTAIAGSKLVVVELRIKNHTDEDIFLEDTDFQLQWGRDDFADPMVALDDSMAPLEMTLAPGEKVEYYYVYSVRIQATDFSLNFSGIDPETGSREGQGVYYVDFVV